MTLIKADLRSIAKAIRLSRVTMRNNRQNLLFAFIYNALGVPISRGCDVAASVTRFVYGDCAYNWELFFDEEQPKPG